MIGKGILFLFLACIMTTLFSSAHSADAKDDKTLSSADIKEEISLIKKRIKELQDKKIRCESRADSAMKTGNRLQFVDFLTARMYFVQEERLRAEAYEAQKEIEVLTRKKEELEKLDY